MTRKALLKLAGYEVRRSEFKIHEPYWEWVIPHTGESSPYFHNNETQSWTSAWKHFKRHNTPKESNT